MTVREQLEAWRLERKQAFDRMGEINEATAREERELTAREDREYKRLERDFDRLGDQIEECEARHPELAVRGRMTLSAAAGGATLSATDDRNGGGIVERRLAAELGSVRPGEVRALTTSISLSPGDLSTHLFEKLRASSVGLVSGFSVLTTDKDSVIFPALTADVSPSWYAEAAAITPGDPTFGTVTAVPRKLAHLVQMSNEVIDDSDPPVLNALTQHLMRVLGLKLDLGFFEGSGTPPEIRGLKNVSGIQTISMGTNGAALTSLDTVASAIALLEAANAEPPYAIVMAPRTFGVVRTLKASGSGEYLLGEPTIDTPHTLFGHPVYVSGQLSVAETQGSSSVASSIYVYAPKEIVYVARQEIELELDRSRLFNSDQSELRGKLRGDLIVPNPTAVVRVLGIVP